MKTLKLTAFAALTIASIYVNAVATASAHRSSGWANVPVEQSGAAGASQWCVDRWNQMRMSWPRTIAIVSPKPRCKVTLAYSFRPYGSTCHPPTHVLPGRPKLCLTRTSGFECRINQFGAYGCPSHASPGHFQDWNAKLTGRGRLLLDHPPQASSPTPLPGWASIYPYKDGFILPWASAGRLRSGLTLRGHHAGKCAAISETTTARGALKCADPSVNALYDPCFPERAEWKQGGVVAACAVAPGSTIFTRLGIRGELGKSG